MEPYEKFLNERKEIGSGMAAKVYASVVFRLTEHDTKRVRQLIDKAFEMGVLKSRSRVQPLPS